MIIVATGSTSSLACSLHDHYLFEVMLRGHVSGKGLVKLVAKMLRDEDPCSYQGDNNEHASKFRTNPSTGSGLVHFAGHPGEDGC